jgi:hemoglobin
MSMIAIALLLQSASPPHYAMPGEEPVEEYVVKPENLGGKPFEGDSMAKAFGGQEGIRRIVSRLIDLNSKDPVIGEIFATEDRVRFQRTLFEHMCNMLNAGCTYTGMDMRSAHKNMGIQQADMNRMVENLQQAMTAENVSFAAQNRLLSKLAPMRRDIVER